MNTRNSPIIQFGTFTIYKARTRRSRPRWKNIGTNIQNLKIKNKNMEQKQINQAKTIDPATTDQITAPQFIKWLDGLDGMKVVDFPRIPYTERGSDDTVGLNSSNMIRVIRLVDPFTKIEVRIYGVFLRAGVVTFDSGVQRVQMTTIDVDRNDWSRVTQTVTFMGRFDLALEFRALLDIVELLSRK
jgi:hypothetical protein